MPAMMVCLVSLFYTPECRVLLSQLGQSNPHFFLSGFGLRLDCDADYRFKPMDSKNTRCLRCRGCPCAGVPQADGRRDIPA